MRKDEKDHLDRVASLGCVVCRNLGLGPTPAHIHHIRSGQGMAQRASNHQVLPLCPDHHTDGGYGVALHAGQEYWEQLFGTELELLEQVNRELKSGEAW